MDIYHPLLDCLQLVVPFKIWELQRRGGPSDNEFEQARLVADIVAEKGDVLLYHSPKKGETAQIFKELSWAVAVAAFLPGGVEIFGNHYEAFSP